MTLPVPDPLDGLDEATFRTRILIPLFRAMGYRDVDHTHGPNELGHDIVMWDEARDGTRDYVAVVVKKGNINARASGDANTVRTQVLQAFGTKISDKTDDEDYHVRTVIVATTGTIRKEAQTAIRNQLQGPQRQALKFWDGETVRDHLSRHLPEQRVPDYLAAVHNRLANLEHFEVGASVRPEGLLYAITPRVDGTVVAQSTFTFPETPEGNEALAAYERFVEGGEGVRISGEHIESFVHHEELERLFGGGTPPWIEIEEPVLSDTFTVEALVKPAARRYAGLSLSVSRAGTKRGTLQTNVRAHPLSLSVRVELLGENRNEVSTQIGLNLESHSARDALQALRVWEAVSDGATYRIIHDQTGTVLLDVENAASDMRPHPLAGYVRDLCAIDDHLGSTLQVPDPVTQHHLLEAKRLRSLLQTGTFSRPFAGHTFTLRAGEPFLDTLLMVAGDDSSRWFRVLSPDDTTVFLGHEVALGPGHTLFEARLSFEEADRVRTLLADGEPQVRLHLDAVGEALMVTVCRDLLPPEVQPHYARLRDQMIPLLDWAQLPDSSV